MFLKMNDVYKRIRSDPKYDVGLIPALAASSVGNIGVCLSESFAERMFSAANDVSTKGNTRLSDEEVEKLTLLRINRDFMEYMRVEHAAEAKQTFNKTIIRVVDTVEDNIEDVDEEEN